MSSLKDLASLIMIPSLYEDGELHTVKPLADENIIVHPDATDNNDGVDGSTPSTSSNFTFSRGSNLAATRVDVNGLIEKGTENLLNYSNDFSNGVWAKSNLSVASSNGAWEVADNTTSGSHYIYWGGTTPNSSVLTLSVEAKAGSVDYLVIRLGGFAYAFFDLVNGTPVSNASFIDMSMESTGGGFYRCSATISTPSSGSASVFYPSDNSSSVSYTGTGSVAITIKNAQLEQGLVATDYIETGASTAQAGILEDMPRLDYSGGASCPALLLEPQRSNLLNHGEYFGAWTLQAGGTGSAPVLEANTTDTLSPEGKYNAYKVTFNVGSGTTTGDESIMYRSKSGLTAGSDHTASVYLKGESGGEEVIVRDTEGSYKKWTLTTEWARYDYTQVAAAPSYATSFGIRQGVVGIINSDAVVYMYGFQSELGSYPTSYIPTYGSSVTRSGDACYLQNADVHSNGAGTIFFEVGDYDTNTSASGFNKILVFDEVATTSLDNVIYFEEYAGNNTILIRKGGSTLLQSTPNYQDLRGSKIAIKWSSEEAKIFIDGVLNKTYTGDASLDIQYFGFDNPYNGDIVSTIKMKQLVGFPTALTDSECIALTTL